MVLVHGLGEHIGRYNHLASRYHQHQMAVVGFDLPGHGKTPGQRGHAANLDALLNSIDAAVEAAISLYPNTPVFLHSQSMGGNLALHYGRRYPQKVRGIIASSPWIGLAFPDPALKVALGRLMRNIWPTLSLPTGLDPRKISRTPEVVAAYQNDPLVHGKISSALGIAILDAAHYWQQYQGPYPVHALLMHGTHDDLTSHNQTQNLAQKMGPETTFHSWPGAYHELHNEPEQADVFQYGLAWITRRLEQTV
jgi:alpha-beta hydrolase superfamily lysophospholipase